MRNSIIFLSLIFVCNLQAQSLLNAGFFNENAKPTNTFRLGKTNLFNQLYFESGVKFSSEIDTIGNLNNSQIGLQHQLTNKLQLFHAYNYLSQSVWWGNIYQHSYYANFEYKRNLNFKMNFVGSYINANSKILASVPPPPIPPNPPSATTPSENISNNNYFFLVSSTFTLNKFFVKPMVAFSQLNNLKVTHNQYQVGGELYYDVHKNEKIVFGLGVFHFINNNDLSTLVKPSISNIINDELTISADYFYAYAKNFSDQDGYIIYNSVDKTFDRTNITLKYEFANNTFLYIIYQFERKRDYSTYNDYNFNSIFLGIKHNL